VIKFVSDFRQVSGFLQVLCVIKFVIDLWQVGGFLQVLCVIKFVIDLWQVSGFLWVLCVIKFVIDLWQVSGFLWVLCVIKFVIDLRQVGGFLWVSSTNKTDCYEITEILLKVTLDTINQISQHQLEIWWLQIEFTGNALEEPVNGYLRPLIRHVGWAF
jgi:hypothetical protein